MHDCPALPHSKSAVILAGLSGLALGQSTDQKCNLHVSPPHACMWHLYGPLSSEMPSQGFCPGTCMLVHATVKQRVLHEYPASLALGAPWSACTAWAARASGLWSWPYLGASSATHCHQCICIMLAQLASRARSAFCLRKSLQISMAQKVSLTLACLSRQLCGISVVKGKTGC